MTHPSVDGLGPVCRRRERPTEDARTNAAALAHGIRTPGAGQLTLDDQEHDG
ncbi:hypothetical protein [Streptomyces sp. NPDC001270]|uniref:hypothetical protein n=1 Tax=Streptomyces sp. NPDC001270 TaxID=3364554 RepID=UPI0036B60377